MEQPKLSVICLSWNHEKYIEQALNSIINQTYTDLEIIYIDNDSKDNSFQIAETILKNANVKHTIKKFEKNIGATKALNYAISELCNGEYISMISMDDWLELDNYELKINYSLQYPQYGIIYSEGFYYYEDQTKSISINNENLKEGWVFDDLLKSNFLFMMGALIKKEVYDSIGLYKEDNSIEDWEFALRVAQKYPIGLVQKPLFYYRQHSTNYSGHSHKYYKDCLAVINKYKEFPNHKIGSNWINEAYISFLLTEKFSFNNLFYMIKNSKFNLRKFKEIVKYSIKAIISNSKTLL
jgi:glycosyltransferase involved in cell wall biosynthesis